MRCSIWWLFLGLVASHGATVWYTPAMKATYACNLQMNKMKLCEDKKGFFCSCTEPHAATLFGCVRTIYDGPLEQDGAHICEEYVHDIDEENFVADALKLYELSAVPLAEWKAKNLTDVPIVLNLTLTKQIHKSYNYFLGNFNKSIRYGAASIAFWLGIFVLYAAVNWTRKLMPPKHRLPRALDWIQRKVLLPATNKNNLQPSKIWGMEIGLTPKRIETIILVIWIIIVIIMTGEDIRYDDNDMVYPKEKPRAGRVATARYLGDRSGIIGTFMLPLLILFAGRNNFLQWLTGCSYASFIVWHKWVARIFTIEILIHTGAWSVSLDDRVNEEFKELYVIGGTFAFIAMFFLCIQAILYLRRRWYEAFFVVHFVLSVLAVAGSWIHLKDLGYGPFVYASVAVWGFDRFARLVRMVLAGRKQATVTLIEDTLVIRIDITRPRLYPAGGHLFLHLGNTYNFWQSHPFCYVNHEDHLMLYAKVKEGITQSLASKICNFPGATAKVPMFLDGPYAEPAPISRYDSALFVSSGNGIPGIISEARDYALKHPDGTVKVIWITRTYHWFAAELEHDSLPQNLEVVVYLTANVPISSSNTSQSEKEKDAGIEATADQTSMFSMVRYGRPDLVELVRSEAEIAKTNLAIVSCGHPALVDELRDVVAKHEPTNRVFVDYFTQLQVWA
ncbi:ferric/cupric reductase transmembrane component 2 [Diutina catenulata]